MIKIPTQEELQKFIDQNKSMRGIARIYGTNHHLVGIWLDTYNIKRPKRIIHSCNDEFFNLDTEPSLYWAGFLAADGCVKQRKTCKEITLAISTSDKNHLLKFKNDICSSSPIRDSYCKPSNKKWNGVYRSCLVVTSKNNFDSLNIKFNVVPAKTHIYKFPERLILDDSVNHFMRGYFDGDGCVCFDNRGSFRISLRGTLDFLEVYRFILEKRCGFSKSLTPIKLNDGIGWMGYSGAKAFLILEFLYKNSITKLDRKYDLFLKFKNNIPAQTIKNIEILRNKNV